MPVNYNIVTNPLTVDPDVTWGQAIDNLGLGPYYSLTATIYPDEGYTVNMDDFTIANQEPSLILPAPFGPNFPNSYGVRTWSANNLLFGENATLPTGIISVSLSNSSENAINNPDNTVLVSAQVDPLYQINDSDITITIDIDGKASEYIDTSIGVQPWHIPVRLILEEDSNLRVCAGTQYNVYPNSSVAAYTSVSPDYEPELGQGFPNDTVVMWNWTQTPTFTSGGSNNPSVVVESAPAGSVPQQWKTTWFIFPEPGYSISRHNLSFEYKYQDVVDSENDASLSEASFYNNYTGNQLAGIQYWLDIWGPGSNNNPGILPADDVINQLNTGALIPGTGIDGTINQQELIDIGTDNPMVPSGQLHWRYHDIWKCSSITCDLDFGYVNTPVYYLGWDQRCSRGCFGVENPNPDIYEGFWPDPSSTPCDDSNPLTDNIAETYVDANGELQTGASLIENGECGCGILETYYAPNPSFITSTSYRYIHFEQHDPNDPTQFKYLVGAIQNPGSYSSNQANFSNKIALVDGKPGLPLEWDSSYSSGGDTNSNIYPAQGYFNEDTVNPNDYIGNYIRVFVKGRFYKNSLECPNCEIHVKLKGKAMPLDPVEENVSTGFEVNITAGPGPSSNQAS
tara:strand:+ start:5146 stop:7020 length:1875 start_codon:yes stop_codon:yes gene_type:complete